MKGDQLSLKLVDNLKMSKNRISPQVDDCNTSEADHWHRVNGFYPPYHPQQILGWVLLFVAVFFTHAMLVPSLAEPFVIPVHCAFAVIAVCLVAGMVTASFIDSADQGLSGEEGNGTKCPWCAITVSGMDTKHCSLCNKCVKGFDHHCKWLNQCIGSKNYPHFILCVTSGILLCSGIFALSLGEIVLVHQFPVESNRTCSFCHVEPQICSVSSSLLTFTVLAVLLLILSGCATALLGHLFVFHLFIGFKGWTTYEYIRNQREKESRDLLQSYFVNKNQSRKKWWLQCPCCHCYQSLCQCFDQKKKSTRLPAQNTQVFLLQNALSSMVYIHPSLHEALSITETKSAACRREKRHQRMTRTKASNRLPTILTTAPSVESNIGRIVNKPDPVVAKNMLYPPSRNK